MKDATYYRDIAKSAYGDKDWIVAMGVLVGAGKTAETLLELGAARVMAIGANRGTGRLPDPERVPQHDLEVFGDDLMSDIRLGADAVANVPPAVQSAIDRFDPNGTARVITDNFSDDRPVGSRPVYGARPRAWQALEDKTTVDALWDRAGVTREPIAIVEPSRDELRRAKRQIGAGKDVVVTGDSREGFNGGAQFVRWLRTEHHTDHAAEFFGAHCDLVRVMPLLNGIPCSIHGMVFSDYVATFRPCEMVVMRNSEAGRFAYASVATFWGPGLAESAAMREVAQRVGRTLREEVDYRGAFTVDGVLTVNGFRPTELNPRFGAGLTTMGRGMADCPLYLVNLAIMAGEDFDWHPGDLEKLVRENAAQNPRGGGSQLTKRPVGAITEGGLVLNEDVVRIANDGESADATYVIGPGPAGGRCRVELDPQRTPRGQIVTPRIARALKFLDERYSLGLP